MNIDLILQTAVAGILVGALYGLAALGLSLAFGVLRILNVAHGELIMLGGYAAFYLFTSVGMDPMFSMGVVFAMLALFGLLLYVLVFNRVVKLDEENRIKNSLLIGFGLTLILQTIAVRLFTADATACLSGDKLFEMSLKRLLPRTTSSTSPRARHGLWRGRSSINARSPKKSPGPRIATGS